MKLAVTGCNGRVGKRVVANALIRGHTVVGVDYASEPDIESSANPRFIFVHADLKDYDVVLKALEGCEGVVHLAAFPDPGDYKVNTHNSNVVLSWNMFQACAELGITRIAQASSVNVITLVYSCTAHYDYFPIDEVHPCLPDEPYGLSKMICELQADTIVRRHPSIRVASLRLHWSVPDRSHAQMNDISRSARDLWGYVQEDSAAEAFLLALTEGNVKWSGHEAFFITAPCIAFDEDTGELRQAHWPDVPIKGNKDMSGRKGFFDCGKAERLLGWVHRDKV